MLTRISWLALAGACIAGTGLGTRGAAQTRPLTSHPIVASVELKLKATKLDPAATGETTQLLISALDSKGAVIVGSGSYVDSHGNPLIIEIGNSSPDNTAVAPATFSKALPSQGVSDVATVTFKGRAHFHFPTFTVTNAGLPSLPKGGVTLTYVPYLGSDPSGIDKYSGCFGRTEFSPFASVGGLEYGPYFALNHQSGCPTGDILRTSPYKTIVVNPANDNAIVTLGLGSDKVVYFAYNHPAPNAPTQFGYLRNLSVRTSANVTSITGLTLGNDGSLWFAGVWHGRATIGKLPPANASGLHPTEFAIPNADAVFGIEPGVKDTEAFLYHAPGGMYLGTIGTGLSGFKGVRISASNSATPGFGDLLAGPGGTFDVSAPDHLGGSIYEIAPTGKVTRPCTNVGNVFRLSDGTGVGFRTGFPAPYTGDSAVVHIVPGLACTQVPDPPEKYPLFAEFSTLLGVDSTTADWIFYNDPNGHRFGVF